ncbi:hypothetical protein CVH10_09830 [Halomonas sp. ND22Bw]|uniref:hypothetical protein n=1 Tax=Halomonas sp. ND22Bw TaxID=2054178 RepID=UPI000D0B0E5E|nr:hypothetical protein CVH10_09830 [Halomonas sp. ND22Bw]
MSFDIRFDEPRTSTTCTFVDFVFDAPNYQEPVDLDDESRQMTLSGHDVGFIYGSDLLGWDVTLGERITADQLDGLAIPGVTVRLPQHGGTISLQGFASMDAAKGVVVHLYEAFYEEFYLGFGAYTLADAPAADSAPERPCFTPVSRRVPALLACNVAPLPLPRPTFGATERATFFDASPLSAPPGVRPWCDTPP